MSYNSNRITGYTVPTTVVGGVGVVDSVTTNNSTVSQNIEQIKAYIDSQNANQDVSLATLKESFDDLENVTYSSTNELVVTDYDKSIYSIIVNPSDWLPINIDLGNGAQLYYSYQYTNSTVLNSEQSIGVVLSSDNVAIAKKIGMLETGRTAYSSFTIYSQVEPGDIFCLNLYIKETPGIGSEVQILNLIQDIKIVGHSFVLTKNTDGDTELVDVITLNNKTSITKTIILPFYQNVDLVDTINKIFINS